MMTTTSGYAILCQMRKLDSLSNLLGTLFDLMLDALRLVRVSLRSRCALAAENLFLRKQSALYVERNLKPRRAKTPTKLTLVLLSRLCVARGSDDRQVKHSTPLASAGLSAVLEVEVEARGRPRVQERFRTAAEMQ
jgi:hypothetical protein